MLESGVKIWHNKHNLKKDTERDWSKGMYLNSNVLKPEQQIMHPVCWTVNFVHNLCIS